MKKQIVFIHGGTAFTKYEDFLTYLKNKPIEDPLGEKDEKRWQSTFKPLLADTYEVYMPSMPNARNAKYEEWKLWFERYHAFLRDDVILIGHSLGGYFLAKYLSENPIPVQIKALFLLAAPFQNDDFGGEDGGDFAFQPENLPYLKEHVGEIHILHSTDDPIVPFSHAKKYKAALPTATLHTFSDKNHFILPEFPEFMEMLQKI